MINSASRIQPAHTSEKNNQMKVLLETLRGKEGRSQRVMGSQPWKYTAQAQALAKGDKDGSLDDDLENRETYAGSSPRASMYPDTTARVSTVRGEY